MTTQSVAGTPDAGMLEGGALQEVVLGVALRRDESLVRPDRVDAVMSSLGLTGPTWAQPAYDFPSELPLLGNPRATPAFTLEIGASRGLDVRWWLSSYDDSRLVQLQADYIATNWRRTSSGSPYPRFDGLQATLEELRQAVDLPQPLGCELTYINSLSTSQTQRIASVLGSTTWEAVAVAVSRPLTRQGGVFSGRLHLALQPTPQGTDLRSALVLTARSQRHGTEDWAGVSSFLALAHAQLVAVFADVVSTAEERT